PRRRVLVLALLVLRGLGHVPVRGDGVELALPRLEGALVVAEPVGRLVGAQHGDRRSVADCPGNGCCRPAAEGERKSRENDERTAHETSISKIPPLNAFDGPAPASCLLLSAVHV